MSKMIIQPYLFFGGRCEEALGFYTAAIGAEVVMLMRFNQSPERIPAGVLPAGFEHKVMHASFRVGAQVLMASDGCETRQVYTGFSLSISVPSLEEADRIFDALGEGGKVKMPLTKTFWSPRYGMLTDRFGIDWMVSVASEMT